MTGKLGGNRKKKTILICNVCHKEFYPKSGYLKQKTCSKKCGYILRAQTPNKKKGRKYPHLIRAERRSCKTCGEYFYSRNDIETDKIVRRQIYCSTHCYKKNRRVSYFEISVGEYLEENGISLEKQVKISKWTFDFLISGTNIIIEADGTYWHSLKKSKERDHRKNIWCEKNGYEIYRIDELQFRNNRSAACDVIIKRWEDFTGQKAELLSESSND